MMLSAYGNPEFVEQATRLGAVGYLLKPIDLPQLLPAIRTGLFLARELENIRQGVDRMGEIRGDHRSINLAVGIIMVHHQLSQPEAYNLLRDTARSRRVSLESLASEIILASEVISLIPRN